MASVSRQRSLFADSWRAHALMFERPLSPAYADAAGLRVLLAFVFVAGAVFFAARALLATSVLGESPAASLIFVSSLLAAFYLLHQSWVRIPFADIGLRALPAWTRRERLYVLQVVPLALVAFALVFGDHLMALLGKHGPWNFLLYSLLTGLLWGMVQEFLYRAWLQTELTRRWGALAGLLAANVLFTFGPLHWDHLADPAGVRWTGLAAVFGIGLFFGLLYRRSGNAWLPALLHGLWPLNMG